MAGTNALSKLYTCATAQNAILSKAQFDALVWVEVGGVGSHGETGSTTNILTYPTWGDQVVQKAKGLTDAGSPEIEVARNMGDAGQDIMRAQVLTPDNYAFKVLVNDMPAGGTSGTIKYNRGLVTGPRHPNGRVEDFDLEIYTLGLQQLQIVVDPV